MKIVFADRRKNTIPNSLLVGCAMEVLAKWKASEGQFAPQMQQFICDLARLHRDGAEDEITTNVGAADELKIASLISKNE